MKKKKIMSRLISSEAILIKIGYCERYAGGQMLVRRTQRVVWLVQTGGHTLHLSLKVVLVASTPGV